MPLPGQLSPERPDSAAPKDQEVRRHIPFIYCRFFVGEPETAPCRIGPLNEYRF